MPKTISCVGAEQKESEQKPCQKREIKHFLMHDLISYVGIISVFIMLILEFKRISNETDMISSKGFVKM